MIEISLRLLKEMEKISQTKVSNYEKVKKQLFEKLAFLIRYYEKKKQIFFDDEMIIALLTFYKMISFIFLTKWEEKISFKEITFENLVKDFLTERNQIMFVDCDLKSLELNNLFDNQKNKFKNQKLDVLKNINKNESPSKNQPIFQMELKKKEDNKEDSRSSINKYKQNIGKIFQKDNNSKYDLKPSEISIDNCSELKFVFNKELLLMIFESKGSLDYLYLVYLSYVIQKNRNQIYLKKIHLLEYNEIQIFKSRLFFEQIVLKFENDKKNVKNLFSDLMQQKNTNFFEFIERNFYLILLKKNKSLKKEIINLLFHSILFEIDLKKIKKLLLKIFFENFFYEEKKKTILFNKMDDKLVSEFSKRENIFLIYLNYVQKDFKKKCNLSQKYLYFSKINLNFINSIPTSEIDFVFLDKNLNFLEIFALKKSDQESKNNQKNEEDIFYVNYEKNFDWEKLLNANIIIDLDNKKKIDYFKNETKEIKNIKIFGKIDFELFLAKRKLDLKCELNQNILIYYDNICLFTKSLKKKIKNLNLNGCIIENFFFNSDIINLNEKKQNMIQKIFQSFLKSSLRKIHPFFSIKIHEKIEITSDCFLINDIDVKNLNKSHLIKNDEINQNINIYNISENSINKDNISLYKKKQFSKKNEENFKIALAFTKKKNENKNEIKNKKELSNSSIKSTFYLEKIILKSNLENILKITNFYFYRYITNLDTITFPLNTNNQIKTKSINFFFKFSGENTEQNNEKSFFDKNKKKILRNLFQKKNMTTIFFETLNKILLKYFPANSLTNFYFFPLLFLDSKQLFGFVFYSEEKIFIFIKNLNNEKKKAIFNLRFFYQQLCKKISFFPKFIKLFFKKENKEKKNCSTYQIKNDFISINRDCDILKFYFYEFFNNNITIEVEEECCIKVIFVKNKIGEIYNEIFPNYNYYKVEKFFNQYMDVKKNILKNNLFVQNEKKTIKNFSFYDLLEKTEEIKILKKKLIKLFYYFNIKSSSDLEKFLNLNQIKEFKERHNILSLILQTFTENTLKKNSFLFDKDYIKKKKNISKIAILTPEYKDFIDKGDLGKIVKSITKQLSKESYEIVVIVPYYNTNENNKGNYLHEKIKYLKNIEIKFNNISYQIGLHYTVHNNIKIFFLHHFYLFPKIYTFYDNFHQIKQLSIFNYAALFLLASENFETDIVITNDWFCGLAACYAKKGFYGSYFSKTKFLHLIHNLNDEYQGRIYVKYNEDTSQLIELTGVDKDYLIDPFWCDVIINPSRTVLMFSDSWGTFCRKYRDNILKENSLNYWLKTHKDHFCFPIGIDENKFRKIMQKKENQESSKIFILNSLGYLYENKKKFLDFVFFGVEQNCEEESFVFEILEYFEIIFQKKSKIILLFLENKDKNFYAFQCENKFKQLQATFPQNLFFVSKSQKYLFFEEINYFFSFSKKSFIQNNENFCLRKGALLITQKKSAFQNLSFDYLPLMLKEINFENFSKVLEKALHLYNPKSSKNKNHRIYHKISSFTFSLKNHFSLMFQKVN